MNYRLPSSARAAAAALFLSTGCGPSVVTETDGARDDHAGDGGASASSNASSTSSTTSSTSSGMPGVCTPGVDATCNYYYPEITKITGTCNPDGTCTCKPEFGTVEGSGLCLDIDACVPASVDVNGCHGNDTYPDIMGTCNPDGTCTCNPGYALDETGRCVSAVCHGGCAAEGDTRCAGTYLQTCDGPGNGCAHHWITTDHCPPTWTCNSDATKCVKPTDSCKVDADCACGCACANGACVCGGAVPPSCAVDADCGPECAGRVCKDGKCEQASSHP